MTLLLSLDDMGILKDLFTSHIFNHLCGKLAGCFGILFIFLFFSRPKTKRVLLLRTAEHELGEEAKSCVFTTLNMSLCFVFCVFFLLEVVFCKYHKTISLFICHVSALTKRCCQGCVNLATSRSNNTCQKTQQEGERFNILLTVSDILRKKDSKLLSHIKN